MPPDLAALAARYHQAFNDRDFDVWREVFDEDIDFVIDGIAFRGVDAAVAYGLGSVSEFRDLYIVPERVVAQTEDIVVTEIRMVTRDPATGRERRQGTVCEINHVRDGRIVSSRSYYMAEPEDDEEALSVPDRREATRIAEEQAALRRVATLVAEDVPAGTLFAAVAAEWDSSWACRTRAWFATRVTTPRRSSRVGGSSQPRFRWAPASRWRARTPPAWFCEAVAPLGSTTSRTPRGSSRPR
jgi:ketosteroid isomerase-like protein